MIRRALAVIPTLGTLVASAITPLQLSGQQLPEWRLVREQAIGPDHDFGRIVAVLPSADGSVYVADAMNRVVQVFDAAGRRSLTIGREGRGPGEFQTVRAAGLFGDTLWVWDPNQRRVTLFGLSGNVLQTVRLETGVPLLALISGGGALARQSAGLSEGIDRLREPAFLVRTSRTGIGRDTLGVLPNRNAAFIMPNRNRGYVIGPQLFADNALASASNDGHRVFVVDRSAATTGSGASFRVTAMRASGDTLWSRAMAYRPRPVPKALRDSILTAEEKALANTAPSPAAIRDALYLPEYYPPITTAVPGADGTLWLRREEIGSPIEHWIVDSTGRPVARTVVPRNILIAAADATHAWVIAKDANDVETVHRYRIEK